MEPFSVGLILVVGGVSLKSRENFIFINCGNTTLLKSGNIKLKSQKMKTVEEERNMLMHITLHT
jgi:hypothetical protein